MEKLLMTQALDERDFLAKKIKDDIDHLKVISVKRKKDPNIQNGKSVEEFNSEAKAQYQSINDNIDRYERLVAAITQSNAVTTIKVGSDEKELTVAKAITIKKELTQDKYFSVYLHNTLSDQYDVAVGQFERLCSKAAEIEDNYKNNFLTSKGSVADKKSLSDDEIKAVELMATNEYPEMVDPLGLQELLVKNRESYRAFIKDLETAIKISNATTFVEF